MSTQPEVDVQKALRPPFEIAISPKVKVRYGYKDAHVELEAKLPVGKFQKAFTVDEFRLGKGAFDQAKMWVDVPGFQRERDAPPQPWRVSLSEKIWMLYGFPDAHAELYIQVISETGWVGKLLGKQDFSQSFLEEEIRMAQDAFSKAATWAALEDQERLRIGA